MRRMILNQNFQELFELPEIFTTKKGLYSPFILLAESTEKPEITEIRGFQNAIIRCPRP